MKKSVNLIIEAKLETPVVRKLRVILPILAAASLFLFAIIFFGSLIYINNNLKDFDLLRKDIKTQEEKISALKSMEGIYNITVVKLNAFEQISSQKKSFSRILGEIEDLKRNYVTISSAAIDSDGKISFSMSASSSAQVDDFVELLLLQEQKKIYSNIEAVGFMKDKKENYSFSISMKGDPSLLR